AGPGHRCCAGWSRSWPAPRRWVAAAAGRGRCGVSDQQGRGAKMPVESVGASPTEPHSQANSKPYENGDQVVVDSAYYFVLAAEQRGDTWWVKVRLLTGTLYNPWGWPVSYPTPEGWVHEDEIVTHLRRSVPSETEAESALLREGGASQVQQTLDPDRSALAGWTSEFIENETEAAPATIGHVDYPL